MLKVLKYIAILLFGFLWFLGCSKSTVVFLVDNGFIKDDFRYGDLYRLSNLSKFKSKLEKCNLPYNGIKHRVNLYIAGDSFTEEGRVNVNEYATNAVQWTFVAEPNHNLTLSEGKRVLIIETVERHFRERFSERPWGNWQFPPKEIKEVSRATLSQRLHQWIDFEVPYKEEMHEAVLFSNDAILKIKELKADFNYKVFGKTDPKVRVVENELVYDLDVDPGVSSVYDPVSDEEIKQIVKNVNQTRSNYLAMGFDEVYLSIIPNKSSTLVKDKPNYNHLIARVEGHPLLTMPLISVWKEFTAGDYYQKGDSHWSCAGQKIWIDKVNLILNDSK